MKKAINILGLTALLLLSGSSYASVPTNVDMLNPGNSIVKTNTVLSHHCCHCHCCHCGGSQK